jgi:hypothetical protein
MHSRNVTFSYILKYSFNKKVLIDRIFCNIHLPDILSKYIMFFGKIMHALNILLICYILVIYYIFLLLVHLLLDILYVAFKTWRHLTLARYILSYFFINPLFWRLCKTKVSVLLRSSILLLNKNLYIFLIFSRNIFIKPIRNILSIFIQQHNAFLFFSQKVSAN